MTEIEALEVHVSGPADPPQAEPARKLDPRALYRERQAALHAVWDAEAELAIAIGRYILAEDALARAVKLRPP